MHSVSDHFLRRSSAAYLQAAAMRQLGCGRAPCCHRTQSTAPV
ncbi:hypothetical protein CLOSTHATH_06024 [Hungatella hathewayi DSM 13479]|uniref:Uncharacterized protein n=1 Tax=Hungatella hathewayi DSM 13479 TaxID=566550 RepID=D3AQW8_9FIRM|nr:hypothetical protein CLOSTHATH_06024 [Hungatella hathewayi DSM 13479]